MTDSLNAKLKANGMTVAAGAPARFIVHVEEKDTAARSIIASSAMLISPVRAGRLPFTNLVCDV